MNEEVKEEPVGFPGRPLARCFGDLFRRARP